MKDDLRSKCETNDYGRPHQGCLALEPLDWWSHANECRKHANMFQCCNSWKHLLPTSLSTSTLFYQSTSARSLLTTALTHTHTLAAFLQIMACSGTLQTMITFENSNMAFLILHGHKVTTRIPWINDFRLEPEAKLELAQQTFPSWKISR